MAGEVDFSGHIFIFVNYYLRVGSFAACSALGLGCHLFHLVFDADEGAVDQDAAAVFADEDLTVHLDFKLTLWRNLVEAAAAGLTLHGDDAQTVAGIIADTLEGFQCVLIIDILLKVDGFQTEILLLLLGLADDFFELALLLLQTLLLIGEVDLSLGYLLLLLVDFGESLADILLRQFDFKILEFLLLLKESELTVITHVVDLVVIACDFCTALLDIGLLGGDYRTQVGDLIGMLLYACLITDDLILEVLHLVGELTAKILDAVDFREDGLQLIEGLEALLDCAFLGFLFSHIYGYVNVLYRFDYSI